MDTIIEVASWTFGICVPIAGVWWGTRRIRKPWARNYARILITPACLLVFAPTLRQCATLPLNRGSWRCTICGAVEDQTRLAGVCMDRESKGDPYVEDRFETWYGTEVRAPHEHDWSLSIGCHQLGLGTIGCSFNAGGTYFATIPRIPSPAIASAMVDRIRRASSSEREEMIRRFSLELEESIPREEFDRRYAEWIAVHPEWR